MRVVVPMGAALLARVRVTTIITALSTKDILARTFVYIDRVVGPMVIVK